MKNKTITSTYVPILWLLSENQKKELLRETVKLYYKAYYYMTNPNLTYNSFYYEITEIKYDHWCN